MAGETNFGTSIMDARIGNPLIYVRRIFICVISSFFASEVLLRYPGSPPNPYQLICDPKGGISDKSNIFITDRYMSGAVATRPQVVVGRGDGSWGDIAIGDRGQGYGGNTGYCGVKHKVDTMFIPIEISVYSQSDLEAENIAWDIAFCIKSFEEEIRKGALLDKIESSTVSPAYPDKSSAEVDLFKVSLRLGVHLTLRWEKSSTLSAEDIEEGFCKISGDPFPISIKDLCVFAKPKNATGNWT